jgi:hypothetical protein
MDDLGVPLFKEPPICVLCTYIGRCEVVVYMWVCTLLPAGVNHFVCFTYHTIWFVSSIAHAS